MLIGQLSRRTGFSKDTIRFYEKAGLIRLPRKSRMDRSYKDYPEELVHTLQFIRRYKDLGFTLAEIRELLDRQTIQVPDITRLLQVVELKITGTDEAIEKLHALKISLCREQQLLLQQAGKTQPLPEMRLAA